MPNSPQIDHTSNTSRGQGLYVAELQATAETSNFLH